MTRNVQLYFTWQFLSKKKLIMQSALFFVGFNFLFFSGYCQMPEQSNQSILNEFALENYASDNQDGNTLENDYADQLDAIKKKPIRINNAESESLSQFSFLHPIQIQSLLLYLKQLGDLTSIYELQSVPFWDLETIQKLLPYIEIKNQSNNLFPTTTDLKTGSSQMIFRTTKTLEKSEGYKKIDSLGPSKYSGSRLAISFRYRFQHKKDLQYGIALDKDAGEAIAFNNKSKGFDFISFHVFKTSNKYIKKIALGDYIINMGQGLIQWQSMAFNKSVESISINRQAPFIKPYQSFGETNFYRGVGVEMAFKNIGVGLFYSSKNIDANKITDSLLEWNFSAFQTSGLHRTVQELDDKAAIHQRSIGGNIYYKIKNGKIGLNAIAHQFNLPLMKSDELYNFYATKGNSIRNASLSYSLVFKNSHFFGEAATNMKGIAVLNGVQIAVAPKLDWVLLHRKISNAFQSLYSNAFTENSDVNSEHGFYNGFSWRINGRCIFNMYADFYQKTWLGYSKNGFDNGKDLLMNWKYSINKKSYLEIMYAIKENQVDNNDDNQMISNVAKLVAKRFRCQLLLAINNQISIKTRVETKIIQKENRNSSHGFLMYMDAYYKPMMKPYAFSVRAALFETDNYEARIYAYESDLPLSYSMSLFYDKGFRWCVNTKLDITKKMTCWMKWSMSYYPEKQVIGSGNDEIAGNKRTDVKLQLSYQL